MPTGIYRRPSAEQRFWSKVRKSSHCYDWQAALSAKGYGAFWGGERMIAAHRFAYELEHGSIPPGTEIDHKCRNRRCVRASHLEAVTHAENIRRGDSVRAACEGARRKWRAAKCCERGHRWAPENTYTNPTTRRRECRTCRLARDRSRRPRRKEGTHGKEIAQKDNGDGEAGERDGGSRRRS